jgi:hypothetical protein
MNWTKLAENRIEEAIANGEFKDLPGRGQPLDLTEYFALPPAERAGAALLKNARIVPPEVELLRAIASLEETLTAARQAPAPDTLAAREHHENQIAALRNELEQKRVAFALAVERRKRRDPHSLE